MTFETQSGNCGELASQVINLTTGDQPVVPPCKAESPPAWTENGCKRDTDITCEEIGAAGPETQRTTGFTRQVTEDGSRLEGLMTLTVTKGGSAICSGTYKMTGVRQ